MSAELLECPFCRGDAYITCNYSHKVKRYYVYVKCDGCGGQGQRATSATDPAKNDFKDDACKRAIKSWNRRGGIYREEITADQGDTWQ